MHIYSYDSETKSVESWTQDCSDPHKIKAFYYYFPAQPGLKKFYQWTGSYSKTVIDDKAYEPYFTHVEGNKYLLKGPADRPNYPWSPPGQTWYKDE